MVLKIFTDGSCSNLTGHGGWAAVFFQRKIIKKLYGAEINTTSSRMEITAVIKALETFDEPADVKIITDSQSITNGVELLEIWKNNGWKSRAYKPIKNVDLWSRLLDLKNMHNIDWEWVKSHSGSWGNNMADKIAGKARLSLNKDNNIDINNLHI